MLIWCWVILVSSHCTPMWISNWNLISTQNFYNLLLFALVFIHNICEVDHFLLDFDQRHFEKGYWVKTRCRISLVYALGKGGIGTWEKRPILLHSLSVGGSYESITNYRKLVVTHKIDSLVASYESCKIEGSCPRSLADCSTVCALWAQPIPTDIQAARVGTE